jgi:hypothetical protein
MNALFQILFLPNFTIEDPHILVTTRLEGKAQISEPNYPPLSTLLWQPGLIINAHETAIPIDFYDETRIEILRLLITAFSEDLNESNILGFGRMLTVAVSVRRPMSDAFTFSLLNVVLGKSKYFSFKAIELLIVIYYIHIRQIANYVYQVKTLLGLSFRCLPFQEPKPHYSIHVFSC